MTLSEYRKNDRNASPYIGNSGENSVILSRNNSAEVFENRINTNIKTNRSS